MAFTRPKASQINFDVTNISDTLIRLNSGQTGSADKDVGLVIERGSDTNAAFLYDESADQFVLVNTTEDGTTSGNVTIASYAGLRTNAIVYGSLNDGTTTLTSTIAELNYVDGVTSNIQTQLDGKIDTTGNNTITSTTAGSSAGPEFELFRDITGADANYIGQIKFSADNDADQKTVFAKITGKISDASDGSEDGIIEIAHQKAGSNNIGIRITSTEFKIMNGMDFDVETHDGSSNGLRLNNTLVTATATELNHLDGVTGISLGSANELVIVDSDGTGFTSSSTLSIDDGNNYIGINQTSPEVTLHMTGDGAQTAQIRMEQHNDTADAPDVRTRRSRGTAASPSNLSAGDYLFRINAEAYQSGTYATLGSIQIDTSSADVGKGVLRFQTHDGTSLATRLMILDSGAVRFNSAYTFPTADGSANQILTTNGSGVLSFASPASSSFTLAADSGTSDSFSTGGTLTFEGGTGVDTTVSNDQISIAIDSTVTTLSGTQTLTNKTLTSPNINEAVALTATATELNLLDGVSAGTVTASKAVIHDSNGGIVASGDINLNDADDQIIHGDADYNQKQYVLYGTTTNGSEAEIFVGGTSASRIPVPTDTTVFYECDIAARRTDATGESGGWHLKAVVDNFSGTVADVGNVYEVQVASDDENFEVDVAADDSNNAIAVKVTGAGGKTIRWVAIVRTFEVTE